MTVPERIAALRERMKANGMDAYMVRTDDYHCSEYTGNFFKCRKFITGFTGSAGTAVFTMDDAGLWTDGRYFIQAADQLKGSGIRLFKMGQEGVPTVDEFLKSVLKAGQTLGFDGRTVSADEGETLEADLKKQGVSVNPQTDLVGEIWENRPSMSEEPIWLLDEAYTGKSRADKIFMVREAMKKEQADVLLIGSLDDIAWLLNIRGDDVKCNPVVLSYLRVTQTALDLYVLKSDPADPALYPADVVRALSEDGVTLRPYLAIYDDVSAIPAGSRVWIDGARTNYALKKKIPDDALILNAENPTYLPKAMKNPVEVENMKKAHVKDGVAMTRFIYWLKTHVGKERVTEISAAEKLEELREAGENYLGPSFAPIISYGPHEAIIHYSARPDTDIPLEPKGTVLTDTGGQYLEGTTDITRTIVLGEMSREEKEFFTRVLRGNLNLAGARFLYGCSGKNLDYLARAPLWEVGEDFNHGTGHGVGCLLNVHEGPNNFHWKDFPGRVNTVFEEGMITSDEPGYYREGAFGIRHENLMVCKKAEKTPAGQFMEFETITMVPFDLEGILPELMEPRERQALNRYHKAVFEAIFEYLPPEEKEWLKTATREI